MSKFYEVVLKMSLLVVLVLFCLKVLTLIQITWGQVFVPWVIAATFVMSVSFFYGFFKALLVKKDVEK